MGAHTRPAGMHRGDPAPLLDLHLSARKLGAATGAAAVVAGTAMAFAPAASAAGGDDFARLRACESSGNYATNTGNGYYGADQFDAGTWRGLGYSGLPSDATPATQDQAAQRLQAARGWSPWPSCSTQLGLGSGAGSVRGPGAAPSSQDSHFQTGMITDGAVPSAPARPVTVAKAPAFGTHPLTVAMVNTKRADVLAWQHQMVARGWHLSPDGYFGPKSAQLAKQFIVNLKLKTPAIGQVNKIVWDAAYTHPVS